MELFKQNDFEFEKYAHEGFSGQKLLATRKSDGKRFIVKHEDAKGIANEFVYFSIAKELGLKTPEFHFFETDNIGKRFKSGCAITIEFIDVQKLEGLPNESSGIKNWSDYYAYTALRGAFHHHDGFEIILSKDGYLYCIDTSDSLEGSSQSIELWLSTVYKFAKRGFTADGWEQIFLDTLRALPDMPIQKINAILNDLCEIYPPQIKKHYLDFLERCETVCAEFLQHAER